MKRNEIKTGFMYANWAIDLVSAGFFGAKGIQRYVTRSCMLLCNYPSKRVPPRRQLAIRS